jgi:hypothetical protein
MDSRPIRTAAAPRKITTPITINGAAALPPRWPRSGGWEAVAVLDRGGAAAAVEEVAEAVCETGGLRRVGFVAFVVGLAGFAGFVAWRRGFDAQHNF